VAGPAGLTRRHTGPCLAELICQDGRWGEGLCTPESQGNIWHRESKLTVRSERSKKGHWLIIPSLRRESGADAYARRKINLERWSSENDILALLRYR